MAFKVGSNPLVVSQNYWSTTTGKHLTAIDGGDKFAKKARVTSDEFDRLLDKYMNDRQESDKPGNSGLMRRNLCLD